MSYDEAYNVDPAPAFEGMVADMTNSVIVSRTVEAEIGFGKPVVRGDAAHKVRLCTTDDTEINGFTVRSQATNAESANVYPAGDTAGVMRKGPIWLKVGEAVSAGDPVKVVVATALIGKTNGVTVAGASFETAAAIGELAKVLII